MASSVVGMAGTNGFVFLLLTATVAGMASLVVFIGCFCWFRREQRRWQRKVLSSMTRVTAGNHDTIVTGREAPVAGELVAQFKVNQGRQILSVLEADGRRFLHVEGELSPPERDRFIRYLKSEGFMS